MSSRTKRRFVRTFDAWKTKNKVQRRIFCLQTEEEPGCLGGIARPRQSARALDVARGIAGRADLLLAGGREGGILLAMPTGAPASPPLRASDQFKAKASDVDDGVPLTMGGSRFKRRLDRQTYVQDRKSEQADAAVAKVNRTCSLATNGELHGSIGGRRSASVFTAGGGRQTPISYVSLELLRNTRDCRYEFTAYIRKEGEYRPS